nr:hypothetical protein [Stenotrophomonas pavanii]
MDPTVSGAWIALGGVAATLAVTAVIAIHQLNHDRIERAKDRALQAKRERLFSAMASATGAMQSITRLANPKSDLAEVIAELSNRISEISSASTVTSIEVMTRGRDLTGHLGAKFIEALGLRETAELLGDHESWMEFADWAIDAQVELQDSHILLVAAVRRDLGMPESSDEQVRAALSVDVKGLEHARTQARAAVRNAQMKSFDRSRR